MTERDHVRLRGVHPALASAVASVLDIMHRAGREMFVVEGVRSTERQQALYAKGRTEKGPKVTNADGLVKRSNHQAREDGYGYAVDLAFTGPEPFSETHPWMLFGYVAKNAGLIWGGDFHSLPDQPHVEWRA